MKLTSVAQLGLVASNQKHTNSTIMDEILIMLTNTTGNVQPYIPCI